MAFARYPRYFRDWRRYQRLPDAEALRLGDAMPQLHERTATHEFDAHYFFANGWAMRRIVGHRPRMHTDVASQAMFVNLLSSVVPVTFVDYRPLHVALPGLTTEAGSILDLPYPDGSLESVSCLHVAEHIGLGRYGDPLLPTGTKQACTELQRVVGTGGNLYFAIPIGRPRVCFNAHRIFSAQTIRQYFHELELLEFSGVDDRGSYHESASLDEFDRCDYACGFFLFRRP
jgi:hypothetical protein